MKNETVYRVYYAGNDDYHFYKGFESREDAVSAAKSLREYETFGKGSVIVVEETTVFYA